MLNGKKFVALVMLSTCIQLGSVQFQLVQLSEHN